MPAMTCTKPSLTSTNVSHSIWHYSVPISAGNISGKISTSRLLCVRTMSELAILQHKGTDMLPYLISGSKSALRVLKVCASRKSVSFTYYSVAEGVRCTCHSSANFFSPAMCLVHESVSGRIQVRLSIVLRVSIKSPSPASFKWEPQVRQSLLIGHVCGLQSCPSSQRTILEQSASYLKKGNCTLWKNPSAGFRELHEYK